MAKTPSKNFVIFDGEKFFRRTEFHKKQMSIAKTKYDFTNMKLGEALVIDIPTELFNQFRIYKNRTRRSEAECIAVSVTNCGNYFAKRTNKTWRFANRPIFNEYDEKVGYEIIRIK